MAPTPKPKNTNQCQNLMLTALSAYYKKNKDIRNTLYTVINGESILSLRLIDWFVTHYARVNNIIYWIDDSANLAKIYEVFPSTQDHSDSSILRKFNLYLDYRAQLQSYTKMFFDPFRRYVRITFVLENEPLLSIESTVGQLNFFRWVIQNGVLDYIKNNISKIEESMANFQKQTKNTSLHSQLSEQPHTSIHTHIQMQKGGLIDNASSITNATVKQDLKTKTKIKTKSKKMQVMPTHIVSNVPCLIHFD
jgi:hypothetical protein